MKSKDLSRRTTVLLSRAEYFFLLQRVVALRKMNKKGTIGSLVRDLIEKEMKTRKKDLWK